MSTENKKGADPPRIACVLKFPSFWVQRVRNRRHERWALLDMRSSKRASHAIWRFPVWWIGKLVARKEREESKSRLLKVTGPSAEHDYKSALKSWQLPFKGQIRECHCQGWGFYNFFIPFFPWKKKTSLGVYCYSRWNFSWELLNGRERWRGLYFRYFQVTSSPCLESVELTKGMKC